MEPGSEEGNFTTTKALQKLGRDIQNLKNEIKSMDFKKKFRNNIKQELNNFKIEISLKLQSVAADVRNHGTRQTEAEQRVEEIKISNTELRDILLYSLRQQKILQANKIALSVVPSYCDSTFPCPLIYLPYSFCCVNFFFSPFFFFVFIPSNPETRAISIREQN